MPSKIAVIGDVNGRLSEVFGKLAAQHAKHSFAFAIIAGNLFADTASTSKVEDDEVAQLLNGSIQVPLPTYFSLGNRSLPPAVLDKLKSADGEVCPNLTMLGRRVSIKTAEGFRLVAVGGMYVAGLDDPMDPFEPTYTDSDTLALSKEGALERARESSTTTDILITSDWPAAIRDGAKAPYIADEPEGVRTIAELSTALKPRYHFSASSAFYEREPFFHNGPLPRSVTRFISLAPYGNAEKQKWIYAFNLEPSASPPLELPPDCTASPLTKFTNPLKRKQPSQNESYNNFRFANGGGAHDHREHEGGRNKRQKHQPPPTADQCYFCISNQDFKSHMMVSINVDCYVTVAKGPLTTRSTFPELGFPGHMLIVPVHHSPTIADIPDVEGEDRRDSTFKEMQRYRSAIHDMIAARSKGDDGQSKLGAVTWEISRTTGVHLHWQLIPVPVDMIQRGLVEAGFDVEAENLSHPKFAKTASEIATAEQGDYFRVMIWSEAVSKEMLMPIDDSFRFSLQLGRNVMGKLLGLENRRHWMDYVQDQASEEADATVFKKAFEKFDFSLEEEDNS